MDYTSKEFDWTLLPYSDAPKDFPGKHHTRLVLEILNQDMTTYGLYKGKWHKGLLPWVRRAIHKRNTDVNAPGVGTIRLYEFDQNGITFNLRDRTPVGAQRRNYAVPNGIWQRLGAAGAVYLALNRRWVPADKRSLFVCPDLFTGATALLYADFVRASARGITARPVIPTGSLRMMERIIADKANQYLYSTPPQEFEAPADPGPLMFDEEGPRLHLNVPPRPAAHAPQGNWIV